jgi:peptide/nickel transport system substrate-binding protein
LFSGLPGTAAARPIEGAKPGGVLRVALSGEPPTLDMHQTPDAIVLLVASHIQETLFTWDAGYRPVPHLAESYEVSEDGLLIRLQLRRHVPFHTGEELTAGDVVASIERWGRLVGLGQALLAATERMVVVAPDVVEFRLRRPFGAFPIALARGVQGCAISPKSVLDRSDDVRLAEYVGTGPYRFGEWRADHFVRLERFADYAPPTGDHSGYAGAKPVYLDGIQFMPVWNEATRVTGMQSGAYHYLEAISPDHYPAFRDDPALATEIPAADSWLSFVLNHRSPPLADVRFRRALQLALDPEAIMQAAFGEGFYELTPGLMPGAPDWRSDAGAERYGSRWPDAARRLIAATGYAGAPLRLLTTGEIQQELNASLVLGQQLADAGVTVDVEAYDGAALSDLIRDPAAWDLYTASASFRPDPVLRNMTCTASGWWCNPAKDALLAELQGSSDPVRRFAAWERVQEQFHEDVPRLKIGDGRRLVVTSARLHDIGPTALQPDFGWAWLAT